ncbi:MAG: CDP-alcohol phosphatidyltransferase family protein [Verrucomicrobia bacterium]|nr:CDP-alcohol phosphatidyltransferase family protein [Verrucomicrobiota bacterium]
MSDLDAWAGAALLVMAAGLLVVAALCGQSPVHARVVREGGTIFLPERVMQAGYHWIDRLAARATGLGLTADAVSWISLALGLAAGILAGATWLGGAAWVLALSGLGDGLDGAMARRQGTASAAGAVLDSVLDRYVEFFYCAGLVVYFAGQSLNQLVVLTALFGGFMVTYSTAKAEALHLTPPRGWMKRPERIVWLIAGSAVAAAARLGGWASDPILLSVVGIIAVAANVSALRRLRALAAAAAGR